MKILRITKIFCFSLIGKFEEEIAWSREEVQIKTDKNLPPKPQSIPFQVVRKPVAVSDTKVSAKSGKKPVESYNHFAKITTKMVISKLSKSLDGSN